MRDSPDELGLAGVAEHLRDDPEFLASWLAASPDGGARLAARLGLDAAGRARLALCRAPRPGRFAADVTAVARHLGVKRLTLAGALRELVAVTALAAVAERGHERPAAAAHEHGDEQLGGPAPAVRLRERAASFWAGVPEALRRTADVEAAIAWSVPLTVVALPALDRARAGAWLAERGAGGAGPEHGHPLRGLLLAARGAGLVFVDGTLGHAERRFTLAHELGHFLQDYAEPRERVLREAPELIEVVDGWREPTTRERAEAALARVPLGLHAHLLERDEDEAEDSASHFALELLAPWDACLDITRQVAAGDHPGTAELRAATAAALSERFTLPPEQAAARARASLDAIGAGGGFFDR